MVCSRCKMVIKIELIKFGLHPAKVELGSVEIKEALNDKEKTALNKILLGLGFLLMNDKKSQLVEKIKNLVVELVHYSEAPLKVNLSNHIADKLHHNYHYLSNLFSEVESTTIEQYFIAQKAERVKELLVYDELSVSEIALQLNYSSASHLSKQFKKATGLTPSHFKQLKEKKRKPIEEL